MTRTVTPNQLAADFAKLAAEVAAKVQAVVTVHGHLLHTAVKRNATQPRTTPRPSTGTEGPRLLTGDYNRSIALTMRPGAAGGSATVSTNKVQGPRLEMGFHGVDSLGRNVEQKPYPHFGPAFDEVSPTFVTALGVAMRPDD